MKQVACRICEFDRLDIILDYGQVALADSFLFSNTDIEKEKNIRLILLYVIIANMFKLMK